MHSKWKKYARHQTQKKIYIEWMEMKGKPMHCAHFVKRNKNKFADFIRIWWNEVVCDWLADFFSFIWYCTLLFIMSSPCVYMCIMFGV